MFAQAPSSPSTSPAWRENSVNMEALVRAALAEDIGPGDVTTEACLGPELQASARIIAKQDLVLSGLLPAAESFSQLGAQLVPSAQDGAHLSPGDLVATVSGPARALLTGERTALNFLGRLSGVATHTASVVAQAAGMTVVDTRKTTPVFRALEKAAVRHGGGGNHRMALYDAILIKENHIAAAGSLTSAIERARARGTGLFLQVEVETLEQLEAALSVGVDGILLDNMDDQTLRAAVVQARGRAMLEASGNMTGERIARLADSGLDRVSMGGLIHQARWVDLSMRLSA
jgi:nicotinate-nucleotide pyrophosphorylase (carboxylating)